MRIAALSDFHIGASHKTDCFGHEVSSFSTFLDQLEGEHDHIVLLGDIFQAQHGVGFGGSHERRELQRARQRVPRLCARFARPEYIYIHGNHDAVAKDALGARSSVRFEHDGFAVLFTHGHQFDPLLRRVYPLTRAATWLTGRTRSVGLGRVADWLEHQDIEIKNRRFRGAHGPYADGARVLLREERADVVVMGHTHIQALTSLEEGMLANTGTCSLGQRMGVSIDLTNRSVRLLSG